MSKRSNGWAAKAGPVMTGVVIALTAAATVFAGGASAAVGHGVKCTRNVGHTGLSAAVVAHHGQTIAHRTINAAHCDIGIFVGARASHVTIHGVTVVDAKFQGIMAADTSNVMIKGSTITDNGFHTLNPKGPALPGGGHSFVSQSFGISLFGVSHSAVMDNLVFNNGRGGIGVMDTGPNNPGAITQDKGAHPVAATDDRVIGNQVSENYAGCAIVIATQNFAGRVTGVLVKRNRVTGTGLVSKAGPDTGGIVVAADPPMSVVSNVRVTGNTVTDSFEGGVMVNAEAFDAMTSGVQVTGNHVSGNDWGRLEAPGTAGIIVFANPKAPVPPHMHAPQNLGTVVTGNTTTDQQYGVFKVPA